VRRTQNRFTPDGILALQRQAGNSAVLRMLALHSGTRLLSRCGASCSCTRCRDGDELDELESSSKAPRRAVLASHRVLQRYAHQDCVEDDLKEHIWPADYLARQMVAKAITALSATSVDPAVRALFPKYFMTPTPDIGKISKVFAGVSSEFADNDYTYECETDCSSDDNGYTWGGWSGVLTQSHIHICITKFRSRSNECLARTIIHEFTHRYCNTDDNGYCKTGCGYSSCPATLTPDKALENADSYACFAYELWPLKLATPPLTPAIVPVSGASNGGPADAGVDTGSSAGPVDAGVSAGVP
jgi:hypothetical protein